MKLTTLCSVAALAVGMAGAAQAYPQFTVNETPYSGTSQTAVDDIGFSYNTQIQVKGTPLSGSFTETGGLTFTTLKHQATTGGGGTEQNAIGGTKLNSTYQLLGNLVSSSGTYSQTTLGSFTGLSANFSSLTLDLYLVPNIDTIVKNANGSFSTTSLSAAGAVEIAVAELNTGLLSNATLYPSSSGTNGGWAINTKFSTYFEPAFMDYFTSPADFYLDMRNTGNNSAGLNSALLAALTPTADGGTCTTSPCTGVQAVNGSGDAFFLVPEPASLTLFGGGLLWAGMMARRRRKKAS